MSIFSKIGGAIGKVARTVVKVGGKAVSWTVPVVGVAAGVVSGLASGRPTQWAAPPPVGAPWIQPNPIARQFGQAINNPQQALNNLNRAATLQRNMPLILGGLAFGAVVLVLLARK